MPNTIISIRYGERPDEAADRPSVVRLTYPTWTLAGEPRLRMPHRMLVIPAVKGNYIAPLTNQPIVMDLDMALRQRRGANRANVGNPVAAINSLHVTLRDKPLTLQWGAELDWGDPWYLTGIELGGRLPAQYPLDIGGSNPRDGGMVFDTIGVRLSFTADAPALTAPVLEQPDPIVVGI